MEEALQAATTPVQPWTVESGQVAQPKNPRTASRVMCERRHEQKNVKERCRERCAKINSQF